MPLAQQGTKETEGKDREGRAIALPIEQAKRLAGLIIDADAEAERQEGRAEMRAKGKTLRGKNQCDTYATFGGNHG